MSLCGVKLTIGSPVHDCYGCQCNVNETPTQYFASQLIGQLSLSGQYDIALQGTKIFTYCTCPAGLVTYNFHSSCKRMHMSF